jgi:hypothetical protein
MKKIVYFLIVVIGFANCKRNTDNSLDSTFIQPKDNIYAVLDSFVIENNINNYIYELYVDKKTPEDYILIIYCGAKSLTKQEIDYAGHIPLNYTMVSGKRFNIFSGIEHYFKRENDTITMDSENNNLEKFIWVVKDSSNIISVYKGIQYTYPFVPLPAHFPNEIFNPPF